MYSVTWIENTCVFYILYGVGHSEASICNYWSDRVNETGEKCQQIGSNSAQYIGPEKVGSLQSKGLRKYCQPLTIYGLPRRQFLS